MSGPSITSAAGSGLDRANPAAIAPALPALDGPTLATSLSPRTACALSERPVVRGPATRGPRRVPHSASGQPLIEIGDDVGGVLQADGQPHNVGAGAGGYALLVGELAVCGGRRVDDQAPHVADVGKMREELDAGHQVHARLVAALEAEGKDGARTLGADRLHQA